MSEKLSHIQSALDSMPCALMERWPIDLWQRKPEPVNAPSSAMPSGDFKKPVAYPVINGVAILDINGLILPTRNWMFDYVQATALDEYEESFDAAMDDTEVDTLLQKVNSPGGSVVGLSEMATKIFEARRGKTIATLIGGIGGSAAFMLASQAQLVTATEGSMVGSIGTIMNMVSTDRLEKNVGLDRLVIRSNELKAPGSGGPITPRQEESLRKILGAYFEAFKGAVARGRPGVDMDKVSTGEVWIGADAKKMGLVDEITTLPKLLAFLDS